MKNDAENENENESHESDGMRQLVNGVRKVDCGISSAVAIAATVINNI